MTTGNLVHAAQPLRTQINKSGRQLGC